MRRMWVVLTVGMLTVLLLATPGLAGGGKGPGHGTPPVSVLQGCISSVDYPLEFEVDVVKSMKGTVVPDPATILTDGSTRFVEYTDEGQVPIEFGDLDEYDPVSVRFQETTAGLLAIQVIVNPDCPVLEGECTAPEP